MSISRQVRRQMERDARKRGTVDMPPARRILVQMTPEANPSAHPDRYPKHHDPDKGQVYGGECNITRCSNMGAVYWNMGTYGLYCPTCADGINWQRHKPPLCVYVDAKPAVEDMEHFQRDHDYYQAIA